MRMLLARAVPAYDGYDVVGVSGCTLVLEHTSRVIHNGLGIDNRSDRASRIDLSHDFVNVTIVDQTVLGNRCVGEHVDFRACSTHTRKCIACYW